MDIYRAFQDITNRAQNSILQKQFRRDSHLIAGQTAEKTMEKVADWLDKGAEKDIIALEKVIDWYFEDYFYHGEKATRFYEISSKHTEQLIRQLKHKSKSNKNFAVCYPLTLDHEHIKAKKSKLVEVVPFDDGIAMVFSTVRYYTERVKIKPRQLKKDIRKLYSDVDEFIGDRKRYRQFFDIVVIQPDGKVEIRIDNPLLDGTKHMPAKERSKAFSEIEYAFDKLSNGVISKKRTLPQPLNLIYAVDNIYFKPNEGRVKQINFSTANHSAKKIVASKVDRNACCRSDLFTRAGTKAVTDEGEVISPYRIYVNWNKQNSYPELHILGTSRNLDVSKNPINEAIITKCQTKSDYDFIREKVLLNKSYGQSPPQSGVA